MDEYEDIIDLPHYEPRRHPRMPLANRAAQFAPFAAVSGHTEATNDAALQHIASVDADLYVDEDWNSV
ncbi:MAG: hypothetical protein IJ745_04010 [Bacteroidales bacterium]|nr:hypothetical protein [Bacteroidales bacterium]